MAAAEEYHPSPNTPDERRVLHVTLMPENKAQAKQKGYKASQATVGWYPGSSNTSIKRCVAVALGLRADVGSRLKVHQDEGRKRPLNLSSSDASMASMAFVTIGDESAAGDDDAGEEKLGEGTNVLRRRHGGGGSRNEGWALTDQPPPDDAAGSGGWLFENVKKTAKTTDWVDTAGNTAAFASVLNTLQNLPTNDLPEDPAFQGAYIKFERVLSHLANERTWLAWVRASLTLLSNAFTIYTLYKEIDSKDYPSIHRSLRYLGMGYVVIVPITCIVGWLRFERTKYILGLTDASLHDFFGTLGVVIQAWLLGAVLCLTIGVYWNSASYYMSNLR